MGKTRVDKLGFTQFAVEEDDAHIIFLSTIEWRIYLGCAYM